MNIRNVTNRINSFQANKRQLFLAGLLLGLIGVIMGGWSSTSFSATSYCNIYPANNNASINSAIAGCADGKTIRFPSNASYTLPDTIFVRDRNNLVIDGRGSTFTITTQGNTKPNLPSYFNQAGKNGGNWALLRGTNITLKNMTAVGSFPLAGQTRDLARESAEPGYAEYMSNFGIYGTNGAYLQDLVGKKPWGDTVVTGPDTYTDNANGSHGGPNYATNVSIKNVRSEEASRMCFALTSGNNMWLEDSYCKNAWYGGSDEELDNPQQPMVGLHVLRNTFEGFNLFGFNIPVPGPNVKDIEIKGNTFLTSADQKCNPVVIVGGYPTNPDTFKNVTIDYNTFTTYGTAIAVDHINVGSISNNKVTTKPGGGCALGAGQPAPLVTVSNSTSLVQSNNGPNAPGAAGLPSGSQPPATPTCSAPTNFAGTPGPAGSGQYNFTWSVSSGATDYSLYYAAAPEQPFALYTGPFTSPSATAYSLNPYSKYNFAVRAKCGSLQSSNSNVVLAEPI